MANDSFIFGGLLPKNLRCGIVF
uniref:Uncharacterized protein n=1 Tax=Arundo donax TaxID=35708 RepID=A0A0A8XW93_ARUDO